MGNPLVRLCITKLKCNYPFFDSNVVNEISVLFLFLVWAFWCQDIQSEKKSIDDSRQLRLKVSENKRFLQYEDGRPFFYLGDAAWELFHRLNR